MELVSKRFHDFLSKPAPGNFWLSLWNFCPPTPGKFRWLKRRILRYQYIESWFTHDEVKWTYECGTVPPVLPSLLAICAPSAELTLKIDAFQSESFFELCAATYGCRPELISFRADLIQHLTVLELMMDFGEHNAQDLEDLGIAFGTSVLNPSIGAGICLED
ncbi:g885 [Coccomyxa viridis]|uniref:G885 protein n=1 Tax=Coccomyxa viridis TaxID=1274662 RepID=A0ABP1FJP6_9CHLO